ncbi:unnamed protein product [Mytilus edulis]|uniref:Reverse transcriptase domain-containing protein n=1 Tax=Mytilus edulis TaxID=6550 RepID=A0A8S3TD36_MYTED|nr:unnamed protein product [Mytilus edulis]
MLNPLAEVFLPSYMKSLESDDKLDNDKVDNLDKGNAFINKCTHFCKKYKKDLLCDVNVDTLNIKINKVGLVAQDKLNDTEFKNTIEIHNQIVQSGYPNYLGCRIPVKSGINVDFFRENLIDYDDEIICEFLQFGAPIGYQGEMLNEGSSKVKNHKGATDFHDEILAYLLKEATYGAIIGPFDKNPFSCHFKISPLNSVYKKDSVERRVILDLSFPPGRSVNDFISKDVYLGERVQLSYPKVDDLVGIIKDKGGKCLVFKKDLKRAYRQIPIDPGDLHLVGFQWDNKLFADRVLPMGLRSSALICQRITTAVSFMFYKMGYMVINYLDDFGGADTVDKADEAYIALGALLDSCGLEESKQKGVAPTTRMEFLGITVDTVKLTLEVTSDRVLEISLLVQAWLRKKKASLRELQSILGKLHFVSTCVRPGRLFVSRLLNWLRSAFPSNVVGSGHKIYRKIPVEVQKDLLWWHRFLSSYNELEVLRFQCKDSAKHAFAESTYKNKKTQLESYFMFCIYFELMPVPATVHVLTLYAQFLSRSFKSVDSIKNYLSSVRYLHLLLDLEYPQFEAFHLRLVLRGLCRIKAHCQKQALPITPHILLQIYKKLDMNSAYDATIWCLFLHAFFLMFRKSNLVPDSISTFDHNKQLCRDSIIFDCKRNFFEKRATIVSASIPKYVSGIDGCTTQAFPGATIGRLTELISSGKVDLISLDFVIVHVGTNNISSSQSVDTIISYFGDLIHKLKKMTFAKLIFTSILPRPVDHMKTGAKVNKVNTELKRLCKRNNLLYCNLYRSFLLDNIPDASLFAPRDGLHLNFAGTELFRKKIINIIKHQSI